MLFIAVYLVLPLFFEHSLNSSDIFVSDYGQSEVTIKDNSLFRKQISKTERQKYVIA